MGGMAAQIPVKNDEAANTAAFDKVRADKLREVKAGHDGTWVAHPALVPVAMDVFNEHMPACNQVRSQRTSPRSVVTIFCVRIPESSPKQAFVPIFLSVSNIRLPG